MSKIQLNSDFIIIFREMRVDALRTLVNNPLKKIFYGKKKKQLMF